MLKLIAWSIPVWTAATGSGIWLRGPEVLLPAALALAICLPLAVVSFRAAVWSLGRGPNWQMGVILGGSAARMLVVLALAAGLAHQLPELKNAGFLPWVVAAYLLTLALEVGLLVGKIPTRQPAAVVLEPKTEKAN